MLNELEGFEVFVPSRTSGIERLGITISKTGVRLTKTALGLIKYPEFVNVFFDRGGKRMMIQPGDKRNQNIMKLSKQGNCPNTLSQRCFMKAMEDVVQMVLFDGGNYFVSGYKVKTTQPILIFDLNKIEKRN